MQKAITIEVIERQEHEGRVTVKTLQSYSADNFAIAYCVKTIHVPQKNYILNSFLYCLLNKEEDYYVITNELLDITGTGRTEEEAKESFAVEFDYCYTRYNELSDEQLSKRLQKIKTILNILVTSVE
ncbi:MAG: hypothetical protein ACOVQA_03545 [Thermoflexibacteraceae bacterium]|jgi:hypothetical protein